jgi:hypothetical protein
MPKLQTLALAFAAALALASTASAQAPADPPVRVRGVIAHVDAASLTVKDRGGEVVTMARPANMGVTEVLPLSIAAIKPNSFLGVGALPQPDGSQRALLVQVFPESRRGAGEGFRPWDSTPNGTMTNATVATLTAAPSNVKGGKKLLLKYKDGEQTVIVPPGTPVVTFKPADADAAELLVPGAQVIVTAQAKDGKPTALRLLVGRNGYTPPQ